MLDVAIAAPTLPAAAASHTHQRSVPVLWHLLSLDAPTVAALWTIFFARSLRVPLPWMIPLVLAAGVWVLYVLDRILDTMRATASPLQANTLRERHYFHARHRKALLLGVAIVLPAALWAGAHYSLFRVQRDMLLLGCFVSAYVIVVHGVGVQAQRRLPKELAVGGIFAAATAIPTAARLTTSLVPALTSTLLFAALCWLNCVSIHRWESRGQPENTLLHEHGSTRWAGRHLTFLATLLALTAFALLLPAALAAIHAIALACGLSALLLLALELTHRRFSALTLRIAADAALLTPLLFLFFL
jgi:hypothetical protein